MVKRNQKREEAPPPAAEEEIEQDSEEEELASDLSLSEGDEDADVTSGSEEWVAATSCLPPPCHACMHDLAHPTKALIRKAQRCSKCCPCRPTSLTVLAHRSSNQHPCGRSRSADLCCAKL